MDFGEGKSRGEQTDTSISRCQTYHGCSQSMDKISITIDFSIKGFKCVLIVIKVLVNCD